MVTLTFCPWCKSSGIGTSSTSVTNFIGPWDDFLAHGVNQPLKSGNRVILNLHLFDDINKQKYYKISFHKVLLITVSGINIKHMIRGLPTMVITYQFDIKWN
jgi:hypothetical protein